MAIWKQKNQCSVVFYFKHNTDSFIRSTYYNIRMITSLTILLKKLVHWERKGNFKWHLLCDTFKSRVLVWCSGKYSGLGTSWLTEFKPFMVFIVSFSKKHCLCCSVLVDSRNRFVCWLISRNSFHHIKLTKPTHI